MSRLDQFLNLVPESLRPTITQYGEFLLSMGLEEAIGVIDLFVSGETKEANQIIMQRIENDVLVSGAGLQEEWKALNDKAAASKEAFEAITGNLLRSILVTILVNAKVPVSVWPVTLRELADQNDSPSDDPAPEADAGDTSGTGPVTSEDEGSSDGSETPNPTDSGDGS